MDRACFRRNCKLVSGRAEVVSAGAEDLVLGVVCVVRGGRGKVPRIRGKMVHFPGEERENGGRINISGGKVPRIRGNLVHFPGRTNQEWAFRIRISERSGSPGAGNFATG